MAGATMVEVVVVVEATAEAMVAELLVATDFGSQGRVCSDQNCDGGDQGGGYSPGRCPWVKCSESIRGQGRAEPVGWTEDGCRAECWVRLESTVM